ncbi:hypothetical protein FHU33_0415 [Blastococcus colisei]|uniref:Uncharacterized protein n=1 Tax=Blastococcus colisei TaxID=1564162 RepID=A0A543PAE9_9ACTN|nr:hypothetical protein [Blastococcus colisei]TQN41061.1 hypothetical protein FHU33_0415 [Blastococcus colisei]
MTTATDSAVTRQTQDYLAAVEHELADLPAEDRSALLEDLALHLEALAQEDDDRPVAVRLGPPADYAADLRAAAGLPPRGSSARPETVGLRERLEGVLSSPHVARTAREMRRLLGELRPAWWVLHGYLVVLLPCLHERDGVSDFPVPAPLDDHLLGAVLVLAAVAGSVALGRRRLLRPWGVLVAAAGVVLLFFTFVAWDRSEVSRGANLDAAGFSPPEQAVGEYPLLSRYGPVTDVLPYAADGTPLEGVLLYDQDGRPLQVGFQEWWADGCRRVLEPPRAADGGPVSWSFPQTYELDRALEPNALGIDGSPVPTSQCDAELLRPELPLPQFSSPAP